jgi:hypothetical protein
MLMRQATQPKTDNFLIVAGLLPLRRVSLISAIFALSAYG